MENYLTSCSRAVNRMALVSKGYVIQDNNHKVFVKVYKYVMTPNFMIQVFFKGKGWSIKRLSKTGIKYIGQPSIVNKLMENYCYNYSVYRTIGKKINRTPDVFIYNGGSNDVNFILDQIFDNQLGLGVTLL